MPSFAFHPPGQTEASRLGKPNSFGPNPQSPEGKPAHHGLKTYQRLRSEVALGLEHQQLVGWFPRLWVGAAEGEGREEEPEGIRKWEWKRGGASKARPPALPSQVTRSFHSWSFLPAPFKHFWSHLQPNPWKNYRRHPPGLSQKLWRPHCFQERGAPHHLEKMKLFHWGSRCEHAFPGCLWSPAPLDPWALKALKGAVPGVCCGADKCLAFCL